ncbi:MAG: hypothetical protein ABI599_18640 [Flavobacteriales bacterium]
MMRLLSIVVCALLLPFAGWAQGADRFAEALRVYQEGDLSKARAIIDDVVQQDGFLRDPEAWLLRGFVYKDLYKGNAEGPDAAAQRETALSSLFECSRLDTAGLYRENASQAYDYLAKTMYNDAVRALNSMDADMAVERYGQYKTAVVRMGLKHDMTARDIEFMNALGTLYTKRYNLSRDSTVWYEKAIDTYEQVLALDSTNYGATYNLATLYYNRGVYRIMQISPENTIPDIQRIQDVSKEFFQLALPYMLKAHQMRGDRPETLQGLEGIHYSLQDLEKAEHYRMLYERIKQVAPQD